MATVGDLQARLEVSTWRFRLALWWVRLCMAVLPPRWAVSIGQRFIDAATGPRWTQFIRPRVVAA